MPRDLERRRYLAVAIGGAAVVALWAAAAAIPSRQQIKDAVVWVMNESAAHNKLSCAYARFEPGSATTTSNGRMSY